MIVLNIIAVAVMSLVLPMFAYTVYDFWCSAKDDRHILKVRQAKKLITVEDILNAPYGIVYVNVSGDEIYRRSLNTWVRVATNIEESDSDARPRYENGVDVLADELPLTRIVK